MKAGEFDYVRPKTLTEALDLLAAADGEAQLMAGGQSLLAMMNLRVAAPALVIDIGRLAELHVVAADEKSVSLGACVTHAAIEDGDVPDATRGLMPHAAARLAYRAIRTRGTIGGSLALADPAAEWPAVLTAVAAEAILRSKDGRRTVPVASFITGIYETGLGAGEIIEAIRIPVLSPQARWGYVKFCRKTGEFANALAVVVRDPGHEPRAVLGAANGPPLALSHTAERVGAGAAREEIERAIANDLAGARERHFDEFQCELHAEIAARAAAKVLP